MGCDCPGLVFASVVATKAHLAINGTVPLDEIKDCIPPMRLVVHKIGIPKLLETYGLTQASLKDGVERLGEDNLESEDPARAFLAAFAADRRHWLRFGVPDEHWAGRRVLRDFCSGELLHCEVPPNAAAPKAAVAPTAAAAAAPQILVQDAADESDDFDDLDDFLGRGDPSPGNRDKRGRRGRGRASKASS